MTRYAAELSYNGSLYFGWQVQPGRLSVQEAVEDVLTMLNKQPVSVTGAGRTDSGVHARAQVCSFDMSKEWDEYRLLMALNSNLPEGISAMRLKKTSPDFHARYDALKREYVYFLWTGKTRYPHIAPFTHWIMGDRYDWAEGVKIPEDIKVMGFDNSYISTLVKPSITTITQHVKDIADKIVDILLDQIDNKGVYPLLNLIDVELIVRASTVDDGRQ